jgi:hypothetical protein
VKLHAAFGITLLTVVGLVALDRAAPPEWFGEEAPTDLGLLVALTFWLAVGACAVLVVAEIVRWLAGATSRR